MQFTFFKATRKRYIQQKVHRNPKEKSATVDLCNSGSILDFVSIVEKAEDPVNCLDVPQIGGFAPEYIT